MMPADAHSARPWRQLEEGCKGGQLVVDAEYLGEAPSTASPQLSTRGDHQDLTDVASVEFLDAVSRPGAEPMAMVGFNRGRLSRNENNGNIFWAATGVSALRPVGYPGDIDPPTKRPPSLTPGGGVKRHTA